MISRIIKISPFLLAPLVLTYIVSMFIHPILNSNWSDIQAVWDRWQALNVGLLAFISSAIAFYISRYNADRQRARDFIAARAFLPDALSSLCKYSESCATLLIEAYRLALNNNLYDRLPPAVLNTEVPSLTSDYKEIFAKCISLAPPQIGDHLAKILNKLQIHQSRIGSLPDQIKENSVTVVTKQNIRSHLVDLGELRALMNVIFDAARGEGEFKTQKLSIDDFKTAYLNLGIILEINNLVQYTETVLNNELE